MSSKIKLLILDLNGLFCYKLKKVIKGVKIPPQRIAESKKKLKHLECSIAVYYDIYFHPKAKDFIKWCLNNFEVGLYSSTTWYNVNTILNGIISKKEKSKLKFIWCRDRCLLHPKYGGNNGIKKHDTIKDLSLIVKNPVINFKREYTMENILAIDDSLEKMRYNPEGSYIIVEPYDPTKNTGINREKLLDILRKRTLPLVRSSETLKETNTNEVTKKVIKKTEKRNTMIAEGYFDPKLIAEKKNILKENTYFVLNNKGKDVNFEEAYRACYYLSLISKKTDEDLLYPILYECLRDFPLVVTKGDKIDFYLHQLKDIYSYYLRVNNLDIGSIFWKVNK